jgi:RHS repeat-associated protein
MLHAGSATFYEEDLLASGISDQRAFLTGPAGPVGVLENRLNAGGTVISTSPRYWHRDHLGSTSAISDQNGDEAGRYRYDPWGKPLGTPLQGSAVGTGNRGFTGHEHLVGGLIHMNGRIYDPVLGRFLSADIVVQMPHNVQSYNRYSYVLNNPLSYTDPSGYFFWFAVAAAFITFGYVTGGVQFARQIAGIAAALLLGPGGPYGAAITAFFGGSSFAAAVFAGFASGGISSGNIQGAFRGALSAGLFFAAGSIAGALQTGAALEAGNAAGAAGGDSVGAFLESQQTSIFADGGIGRAGLHAIAGCVGAVAGGAKCGSGALSAAFAEFAGPKLPGGKIEGLVSRAIVGGIASELGGGKFANGAITASFGYLFNCVSHRGTCGQSDRPEIAEGYAACSSRACEDEYRRYAAEAGVKIPISMRQTLFDFMELIEDGMKLATPIGRTYDLGADAFKFVKNIANDSIEWAGGLAGILYSGIMGATGYKTDVVQAFAAGMGKLFEDSTNNQLTKMGCVTATCNSVSKPGDKQ